MDTHAIRKVVRNLVILLTMAVLAEGAVALAAPSPGEQLAGIMVRATPSGADPMVVEVRVDWLQAAPSARVRVVGTTSEAVLLEPHDGWTTTEGSRRRDLGPVVAGSRTAIRIGMSPGPGDGSVLVLAERISGRITSQVLVELAPGPRDVRVGAPAAYRLIDIPGLSGRSSRWLQEEGELESSDHEVMADPTSGRVLIEALDTVLLTKAQVFAEDAANRAIPEPTSCGSGSVVWGVTRSINIGSAPGGATINALTVHVEVTHPDMSDIEMGFFKDSTSGQFLWDQASGVNLDMDFDQDFYGQPFYALGGQVNGQYQLTVRDCSSPDTGTLDYWSVTVQYSGTGSVDLVADGLSISPSSVNPGGSVSAIYSGHVAGTASTGSSYTLGFYLSANTTLDGSDVLLQRVTESSATDPGDSFGLGFPGRSLTIPGGTSPGSYQLGFVVDDTSAVAESNEANNILWQPLTVTSSGSQPNLQAVSCSVSPTSADAGDSVDFTWRGRNNGTTGAGPFVWGVYLSSDATIDPATDQLMAALDAPGGWSAGYDTGSYPVSVSLPGSLADGTYHLGIYLDTYDAVAESNESDNWCATPLTVGSSSATCTADANTLCLNNGRFRVTADWATSGGQSGSAGAVSLTGDTGYFWFFNSNNVEAVVKVLKGCSVNSRYWVFAAGLTNVEVELRVEDTVAGGVQRYTNDLDTDFLPILDTDAFATCP